MDPHFLDDQTLKTAAKVNVILSGKSFIVKDFNALRKQLLCVAMGCIFALLVFLLLRQPFFQVTVNCGGLLHRVGRRINPPCAEIIAQ